MQSIRLQSTVKYMLAGLAFVLFVSTGVEALPTKVTPSTGAPSCPIRAPQSKLHKRTVLVHPSGKTATTLFHGTQNGAAAKSMEAGVDLSKTHKCGDLHHDNDKKSEGGAYFTDSVIVAAQFACYKDTYDPSLPQPASVHVLEFSWTPGTSKVYEFKDLASVSDAQCRAYDMITGPMHNPLTDKDMTKSFWQYAIVNQASAKGLVYHQTYEVHCKNVPKGPALTDELYEHGQGGNSNCHTLTTQLVSATGC